MKKKLLEFLSLLGLASPNRTSRHRVTALERKISEGMALVIAAEMKRPLTEAESEFIKDATLLMPELSDLAQAMRAVIAEVKEQERERAREVARRAQENHERTKERIVRSGIRDAEWFRDGRGGEHYAPTEQERGQHAV